MKPLVTHSESIYHKPSLRAFTLIELPVVIAILAAMLLPALSRAKLKTTSVAFLGNQKQLKQCLQRPMFNR